MLRVLVVEQGPDLRIKRALQGEAYDLAVFRPDVMAEQIGQASPDLLVLDTSRDSPADRTLELLQPLLHDSLPCLLVVGPDALASIEHRVFAGDFLVASGNALPEEELRVRLRRLVRAHLSHKAARAIVINELVIDAQGHEVRLAGRLVELTYQEFLLLAYLAANRGKACTRQQLLARVWGYNHIGGTRTVDIHVRRIREKLGPAYSAYVQTIRHVGYKFSQEIEP